MPGRLPSSTSTCVTQFPQRLMIDAQLTGDPPDRADPGRRILLRLHHQPDCAFTQLLRNVARLNRVTTDDKNEVTRAGARAVGIPEELVADMLSLERRPGVPATDPSRLFPEYLAAVEQLARAVDGWRA